jgi:hypothetical protein
MKNDEIAERLKKIEKQLRDLKEEVRQGRQFVPVPYPYPIYPIYPQPQPTWPWRWPYQTWITSGGTNVGETTWGSGYSTNVEDSPNLTYTVGELNS